MSQPEATSSRDGGWGGCAGVWAGAQGPHPAPASAASFPWPCHPKSCSSCPPQAVGEAAWHAHVLGDAGQGPAFIITLGKAVMVWRRCCCVEPPLSRGPWSRSRASSHICVVMVNFHPGTGKPWHSPKISQALCGCWAFLGSAMDWVSIGLCPHADRVSGNSTCPAGSATLSCCG